MYTLRVWTVEDNNTAVI